MSFENGGFSESEKENDQITILFLGSKRAGKTTIKERVFDQLAESSILYIQPTTDIKVTEVKGCFKKLKIIDVPGSQNILDQVDQANWALPVEKNGLDLGEPNATLAVIFVIDADDQQFYHESLEHMSTAASALHSYNPRVIFEVFLHKVDRLSDDQNNEILDLTYNHIETRREEDEPDLGIQVHATTAHSPDDRTLWEATSKVLQRCVKETRQLENLLNLMINKALVDRAYLFDVRTKLYIAMDNINSSEMTMLDICSGMIEMVDGIANYDRDYESRDDVEDAVSSFDENTESWVTMSNNHLTCLFGVTPTLALVTQIRDDVEKNRGPFKHNVMQVRQAVRDMLKAPTQV